MTECRGSEGSWQKERLNKHHGLISSTHFMILKRTGGESHRNEKEKTRRGEMPRSQRIWNSDFDGKRSGIGAVT